MTAQEALVLNNPAYERLDEGSVNVPEDTSFTVSNTTFQDYDPSCGDKHLYDSIPVNLHNHDKQNMSVDGSRVPAT